MGQFHAAFTLRSVLYSLLIMLFSAIAIQIAGVLDAWNPYFGGEPLPAFVFALCLAMYLSLAAAALLHKNRLITRAEMYAVLYACMIASPLMTHGFWRNVYSVATSIIEGGEFTYYDTLHPSLWPHGPNQLQKAFAPQHPATLSGGAFIADTLQYSSGDEPVLVLQNSSQSRQSQWRLSFDSTFAAANPYTVTAKTRVQHLAPGAYFIAAIVPHGQDISLGNELWRVTSAGTATALYPDGFFRFGIASFHIPSQLHAGFDVVFALKGAGEVAIKDPQMFDVTSLNIAKKGIFTRGDQQSSAEVDSYREMPHKPGSLGHLTGASFALHQWIGPLSIYIIFTFFVFIATFALAVIVRRQWFDYERFTAPLAQLSLSVFGEKPGGGFGSNPIYKNPFFSVGAGLGLVWGVLRIINAYTGAIPLAEIRVELKPILSAAAWGGMWDSVVFTVFGTAIAVALLMELNMSLSIVVGFLIYRSLFWLAQAQGLSTHGDFPFANHQMIGGFLCYALLIVFFMRAYLWQVIKKSVVADIGSQSKGVLQYRYAMLVLLFCGIGISVLSLLLGFTISAMVFGFLLILAVTFIGMKIRTEAGVAASSYTPLSQLFIIFPLFGGLSFFGVQTTTFLLLFTALYQATIIGGLQLEFIEVSKRLHIKPNHVVYIVLLGFAGGMFIGGWSQMITLFSNGANSFSHTYDFAPKNLQLQHLYHELIEASTQLQQSQSATGLWQPEYAGLVFNAVLTALVTILRQFISGFWFHPIGVIVSSSHFVALCWGSILTGLIIRFIVLRIGGAGAVRAKLIPAAVGLFVGSVLAYLVATFVNATAFYGFEASGAFKGIM